MLSGKFGIGGPMSGRGPGKGRGRANKVEKLESETSEVESLLHQLRSQMAEERAKVQNASHWVAAEGPAGKFDPHGPLARRILARRVPVPSPPDGVNDSPRSVSGSPRTVSDSPRAVTESAGGALWGPHPDEDEERRLFQAAVQEARGPPVAKTDRCDVSVDGRMPVQPQEQASRRLCYFDQLVAPGWVRPPVLAVERDAL